MLIDTHCHIHWKDYPIDPDGVIKHAHENGVTKMICVGTNYEDSILAAEFAKVREGIYLTVGIHPHYADNCDITHIVRFLDTVHSENGFAPGSTRAPAPGRTLAADVYTNEQYPENSFQKIVAVGEIGLDYFRSETSREDQIKLLQQQIELAIKHDLPIIFHVRDAYDDFWPILDNFNGSKIRGVLHSFTDNWENAQEGLRRGLFFGVNGVSTFKNSQKEVYQNLPLEKIVFETDSPFLTPTPYRGKIDVNEPAYIKEIAEYNASLHGVSFDKISQVTTDNATSLFNL